MGYATRPGPRSRGTAARGTTQGNDDRYAVRALTGGAGGNHDTVTAGSIGAIRYGINRLRVPGGAAQAMTGHRDHHSTGCPGNLYSRVLSGEVDPGGPPPPPRNASIVHPQIAHRQAA
ncbi:hypothetical protein [Streptomyces filamentosus]|uniref:hypothetical protein n=1 Tax=Streptomyces filamentosus TaxID=67294 RepID=UPI001F23791A|nr:hypothetical protein [Streptomyces filamentosus]